MKTLVIDIDLASASPDILIAYLAEMGFEGFVEEEARIRAFIPVDQFDASAWAAFLEKPGMQVMIDHWQTTEIPEQNWNSIWESAYDPVMISDDCLVRAPFHDARPDLAIDLVIAPKMSFGTAHHETTRLMMLEILKYPMKGKKVLDLGCGTGILSILAEKRGAKQVFALDTDGWAAGNTAENIALNGCTHIHVQQAAMEDFNEGQMDLIMANIDLNVLRQVIPACVSKLGAGGSLMVSGFYQKELPQLQQIPTARSLELLHTEVLNDWLVAVYVKPD